MSSTTQLAPDTSTPGVAAPINRIPSATYRLQFRAGFGFDEARGLVDYLEQLGISDVYLSPLFRARKDSSHGYDVVSHATMEREFGEPSAFDDLALDVRRRGMGILLDVVPNHMGINDPGNHWWNDVLESGEASRYAHFFDIDWHRLAENLRHKILLPVLGDHFGRALEQGELRLLCSAGRFRVAYRGNQFPLSPLSWPTILRHALSQLADAPPVDIHNPPTGSERVELEGIASQLTNLPPRTDRSAAASRERYREQTVAAQRLASLVEHSLDVRAALEKAIEEINGVAGQPATFDTLEALLDEQWYRLAFWRVATDEINYRRFFDINDLAAIRVEEPEVFAAVHALVERLLANDRITGVRVDHPDGLFDPRGYFDDLQQLYCRCRQPTSGEQSPQQLYVVVEKILTGEEPLPDWPVCGTTGYELLNDISRLLVNGKGVEQLRREYGSLTGVEQSPAEIIYESKKRIIDDSMPSEVYALAGHLHRLAQRHRLSRDFTFPGLLRALRELIACFPAYRTYVPPRGWDVEDADYARITAAVRSTKRRNPTMEWTALDFVASVLLLQYPSAADDSDREQFREFVLRFQQVTGPVTAKGIEDTAFYRYFPLVSLNEVGGQLDAKGLTVDEFHRQMQHRAHDWPHGLSATATHDSKRGEDVRARLHVLSEVAETWMQKVKQWQALNRPLLRMVGGEKVPNRNEEYLLYQTLVGTWPLASMDDLQRSEYVRRITEYFEKAMREAKISTSWANPVEDFEAAALGFARDLLDPKRSSRFLQELHAFVGTIADAGFINGLAQVVLKGTVPGVPDFYQGTELWDFSLVDPDNRRQVDYGQRRQWLGELHRAFAEDAIGLQQELLRAWPDPRVKLFVVWRTLQARAEDSDVLRYGTYLPLAARGAHAEHILALARCFGDRWIVAAAALRAQRLLSRRERGSDGGLPAIDWQDTAIDLPPDAPRRWRNVFFNTSVESDNTGDGTSRIAAERLLSPLPAAILTSQCTS